MAHAAELLERIRAALGEVGGRDLHAGAVGLLGALGYRSPKTLDAPVDPREFVHQIDADPARLPHLDRWREVRFLFQLTGDELPALWRGRDPVTGGAYQRGAIDSFVFLAVDGGDADMSRRELVTATRTLNRAFAMPVILLFRLGDKATLAVIDRRPSRRASGDAGTRDVVGGRVSLIKDVDLRHPHRAHLEILADLSLPALAAAHPVADFRGLYDAWLATLSAAELNKRFYDELVRWFAWAATDKEQGGADVMFPRGQGTGEGAREVALIRLLTRLMFTWFIKEKGLVPPALFDRTALAGLLHEAPDQAPDGHDYYMAILQNLFFATLNTESAARSWRQDSARGSADYLGHHVYRHAAMFRDAPAALAAFAPVPFLNGGLFECLDVPITDADDDRAALAEMEGRTRVLRVDGFSDQGGMRPCLYDEGGAGTFATMPDLLIKRGGEVVLIADAKWKRLTAKADDPKQGVSQADVYQMMAYGLLYRCRRLLLVYPHHAGLGPTAPAAARYRVGAVDGLDELAVASVGLDGHGVTVAGLRELVDCLVEPVGMTCLDQISIV